MHKLTEPVKAGGNDDDPPAGSDPAALRPAALSRRARLGTRGWRAVGRGPLAGRKR